MSVDPQPDPLAWPECEACGAPYVLRRVLVLGGSPRWVWQRDCKHKGAAVKVAGAGADQVSVQSTR